MLWCVQMTGRDQNEKELLQRLTEREERYRSVTETSPDAIITTASDGRILTMNQAGQKMFGHGPAIIGQPVEKLIPAHLRQPHREGVERYLATRVPHIIGKTVELSALKADGSQFPIEMTLSAWEGMEGITFGAIIRDIGERKRVEALKEDVARMMRHDMRSPLVGIVGLANRLAAADNLEPKQSKAATAISDLGKKMLSMLDRSRDFFQLEEGTYRLKPEPVNLLALVQSVMAQLETMARANQVEIRIEAPSAGDFKPVIHGEVMLLENMLANLVKNAIEASPVGGRVTVELSPEELGHTTAWRLDIHNQGEIPPEIQSRFFDAYVTSGKQDGSGLGTHNAMMVVRAHGGEISFITDVEEGTHLVVNLPETPPYQDQ